MRTKTPVWERMLKKVDRDSDAGCWNWTGWRDKDGYGRVWRDGKNVYAHRAAYEANVAPIPRGMQLDHLCRNTRCVNPAHLEVVTGKENLLRGDTFQARNAAKTHCPKNHPLSGENLYVDPRGLRNCRACLRDSKRRYRAKREQRECVICGSTFPAALEKPTKTCSPRCKGALISRTKTSVRAAEKN